MRLKKSLIKIGLFCILSLGLNTSLLARTPMSELKALLSGLESLSGDFQQKVVNEKGGVLQKSAGKIWLKKPGKFRWEVKGKDQRVVVADGHQIWDYDIDLEQVTVQPLSEGQAATPIFFLTGQTDAISRDFTVEMLAKDQALTGCDQSFELTPKQQQGAFQWIRIGFKDKILKELEVLDQLGQHAHFQFDQLVLNSNIPPKQFQFTPPKGVDVVGR